MNIIDKWTHRYDEQSSGGPNFTFEILLDKSQRAKNFYYEIIRQKILNSLTSIFLCFFPQGKNYKLIKKRSTFASQSPGILMMEEPKLAYNPYGGVGQTKNVNQMLTHPIAIPNAKYNDLTQSKMTSYSEFASWNHLDQISPYWWILLFHIIIQMVSHFDIESTEFTFWKTTKFSLVSTNERNKAENKRLFSVDKFASCQPQCVILNSKRQYKRIIRVLWMKRFIAECSCATGILPSLMALCRNKSLQLMFSIFYSKSRWKTHTHWLDNERCDYVCKNANLSRHCVNNCSYK